MSDDRISDFLDFLNSFSASFGSGSPAVDVAFLSLFFSLAALVVSLLVVTKSGRAAKPVDQPDRNAALGGKLEKLERSLNEFRTQTLRSLEQIKNASPEVEKPLDEEVSEEIPEEENREEIKQELSEPEPAPLGQRLKRSRFGLFERLKSIFSSRPTLDKEMVSELRAQLIGADLGVRAVDSLIGRVEESVQKGDSIDERSFVDIMKSQVLEVLRKDEPSHIEIKPERRGDVPCIVMIVGVNGAGKTTSVAKLSSGWKKSGAKVLMVAADTFRAAAVDQLVQWGERLDIPVVSGAPDAKPATVVFDAMQRAQKEAFDIIVIDTAGRLHTKVNLMQELAGIKNAIQRHFPSAPHEVLLVVDGSTGQNALAQAREFNDAVQLTGIVITKLDGTPKGGIVVAIKDEFGIPVRYIGVGESAHDLRPFVASDFVEALFDTHDMSSNDDAESEPGGAMSAHGEVRRRRRAA